MHTYRNPENIVKSRTKNKTDISLHKVKDKTGKPLQKRMKDPTLEGMDEDKVEVGRIQEKSVLID